jgi:hypothetical protein
VLGALKLPRCYLTTLYERYGEKFRVGRDRLRSPTALRFGSQPVPLVIRGTRTAVPLNEGMKT